MRPSTVRDGALLMLVPPPCACTEWQRESGAGGKSSKMKRGSQTKGELQAQIRANLRLQRQIDESRSRVTEVKDVVRTALARHFVGMLYQHKGGCFRALFCRWAVAAGVAPTTPATDASSVATPGHGGSGGNARPSSEMMVASLDGNPLVSPAMQRLGLAPHSALARQHSCSCRLVTDESAPSAPGDDDAKGPSSATLPGWMRASLRNAVAEATGPGASGASVASAASARSSALSPRPTKSQRSRAYSLAGHVPEEVLAERGSGSVVEYRVKWKGFASSQSVTWELASQLAKLNGFDEALRIFRATSA
jgi:hypothetical protein